MISPTRQRLVVIGNGMVGHKFLQLLIDAGGCEHYQVVTFCEEPRLAYDRVHLSEFFAGKSADDLAMTTPAFYADNGVEVHIGVKAEGIDREAKVVLGSDGSRIAYDRIVLATGSFPFVPPVPGHQREECLVYRTIEDLEAMQKQATSSTRGVVVGGGLLGLECANALKNMGLDTHVVEFAPQLMGVQVDSEGGEVLRGLIEELGVSVHTGKNTKEIIDGGEDSEHALRMNFADGEHLDTDMIVFSAGIRPRDELARDCGLIVGPRGGVQINEQCRTSDPDILAIGEVALYDGRIFGLVAPGNTMAAVAVAVLLGEEAAFTGADMSTKLKLMGVDVASFGDSHGRTPGSRSYRWRDEVACTYKRIVVDKSGTFLLGGILVGDAAEYDQLHQAYLNKLELPAHPESLILPDLGGSRPSLGGPAALPDSAMVCSCNNVSKGAIVAAVRDGGARSLADLKGSTKTATGCGGCSQLATAILNHTLEELGETVDTSLCEHFPYTRQELHHLVRVQGIRSFQELLDSHGQGDGCEICKPAVASILASVWNEYILAPEHAGLQDSNDYFLANIQKDGTYSVVPRVPGGEITADQLIAIGRIAKDYDLYTKITGGQRIDLFGAQAHQLPEIWARLIEAGMESGHAYGKAFRTCKTCVGTTWCRYGQQDSVGLGVRIEHRYKGLRAPHKLKFAVSGCTRECAEAQSKDVGIIATEVGYNLYLCGNGGMKPRHAELVATDLDEATLLRYVDRFLMFYIRTGNRLERTATWCERLEGGMEYIKQVVIEDSLGIAAELEADMQRIIENYQDEWRTTIEDPNKMQRFRHFINAEGGDPDLNWRRERGQRLPAMAE